MKRTDYRSLGHCKWCNEEIFGTHHNKLVSHQQWCKKNPKLEENRSKAKAGGKIGGEITKKQWKSKKKTDYWLEQHKIKHNYSFVCKNPDCQTIYELELTNEQFQKKQYSKFCSSSCAHSYSAKHVNPKNIKTGMKKSTKTRIIKCSRCGKDVKVSGSVSNILCEECKAKSVKNLTGKCMVCGKEIPFNRKTCCKEHAKILRIQTYKETQKKRHTTGGKRHGSGRGKKGWYKGYYCDSTWELAWIIYQLDHNVKFERYTNWFPYEFNGESRKYYPDFIMEDGSFSEIKGYVNLEWQAKLDAFPKDKILHVYYKDEMRPIFDYVVKTYGNEWMYMYDGSKPSKDRSK